MFVQRIAVSITLMALLASPAMAQSNPGGTLVGHIVECRQPPVPLGAPDGSGPDLADVTPGLKRRITRPLQVPLQSVEVAIQGTGISATTDASGGFTLSGVPAAQPLTVLAQFPPATPLVLSGAAPVVTSGQTLDLGTLSLGDCASGAFVPQAPPPSGPPDSTGDVTIPIADAPD